jgi:threonine dehydratase
MQLPSLDQIQAAQSIIYRHMPPTPQFSWPLLNQRLGSEAWIKHENHTTVGAFKLRGALVSATWLKETQPGLAGIVAATRGNFGIGVGMAARLLGIKAVIVVPRGNSADKNRALRAQGVELVEHGHDFQESLEYASALALERGFVMFESFHERLVWGTATYALELLQAAPRLDIVYVPIGMGSSICGMAAARNALQLPTEIVGVTSSECRAAALSFKERKVVEAPARSLLADGLACRKPNLDALEIILSNVSRIVEVSEAEIAEAMGIYYQDTHNLAEGAGAASLAGAIQEKNLLRGKRVGIVLTGGNVDREIYFGALNSTLTGALQVARSA